MKIALCDDNNKDIDLFLDLVSTYERKSGNDISVSVFENGEDFLRVFQTSSFDAVFLDIYMGEKNGVAVAKEIRKCDEEVRLIFTTTSTDHYADGFSVEASHYLVKPLTEEKISEAMHRLRTIFAREERFLTLPSGRQEIKIPQSRILYIETIRNGIEVHCKEDVISIRCPLSLALKQLTDRCFLQCHRFSVVNLEEVEEMDKEAFVMSDGNRILFRKNGRKELKEAYHRYLMECLRREA